MEEPDFNKNDEGLLPVIVQDAETSEVLMLAYTDKKAWEQTLETGTATYWSRSRGQKWVKGESSGNIQNVREIFLDCDLDTILYKVDQIGGAACHQGYRSCFYRKVTQNGVEVGSEQRFNPDDVYGQQNTS